MVYCNYVSHDEEIARYRYGGYVSDITGIVDFELNGKGFYVVKEPDRNIDYLPAVLMRLYPLAMKKFRKGLFPEKLSYEI